MLTSRQKRLLIGAAVLLVLTLSPLLLLGLVRHTTSDRNTCLSCHTKIEGASFWAESPKHRSGIGCRSCHASQNSVFTTHFSKYTDLVSFNCRQCHWNAMVGNEAKVVNVFMPDGGKVYAWKLKDLYLWHVTKETATCTHCHYNIAHDSSSERTYQPVMEFCAGCHYHAKKDDYARVDPLPKLVFVGRQ